MARYPIIFFWDPGPCPKKIWDHAKQTMQYEISLPRQEFQFQTELDFEDIFSVIKKMIYTCFGDVRWQIP